MGFNIRLRRFLPSVYPYAPRQKPVDFYSSDYRR